MGIHYSVFDKSPLISMSPCRLYSVILRLNLCIWYWVMQPTCFVSFFTQHNVLRYMRIAYSKGVATAAEPALMRLHILHPLPLPDGPLYGPQISTTKPTQMWTPLNTRRAPYRPGWAGLWDVHPGEWSFILGPVPDGSTEWLFQFTDLPSSAQNFPSPHLISPYC